MNNRKVNTALFLAYCALMLWLLFDRPGYVPGIPYWEQAAGHLNLIPFRTLRLFAGLLDSAQPEYVRSAVINLAGNIIMFVPSIFQGHFPVLCTVHHSYSHYCGGNYPTFYIGRKLRHRRSDAECHWLRHRLRLS